MVLLERLGAIGLEVNGSKCELCNKAMRSVFSQVVGRCFRGSGEASSTVHPTPRFVPEGFLSSKSMLDNFLNHIEQESKNCDRILNEMQNLIIFQVLSFPAYKLLLEKFGMHSPFTATQDWFQQCRHCCRDHLFETTTHFGRCYPDFRLNLSSEVRRILWRRHIQN